MCYRQKCGTFRIVGEGNFWRSTRLFLVSFSSEVLVDVPFTSRFHDKIPCINPNRKVTMDYLPCCPQLRHSGKASSRSTFLSCLGANTLL